MIELKNLSKKFMTSDGEVQALKDVNITVGDGDIYGIIGMSGAGKSTLVRCINMLERPTGGEVIINGQNIGELSPSELRKVRRQVTMIFQSFNLLMQGLKRVTHGQKRASCLTRSACPTRPVRTRHSSRADSNRE